MPSGILEAAALQFFADRPRGLAKLSADGALDRPYFQNFPPLQLPIARSVRPRLSTSFPEEAPPLTNEQMRVSGLLLEEKKITCPPPRCAKEKILSSRGDGLRPVKLPLGGGTMNGGVELVVPEGTPTLDGYVCKTQIQKETYRALWESERAASRYLKDEVQSIGCDNGRKPTWAHTTAKPGMGDKVCEIAEAGSICTKVGETEDDVPLRGRKEDRCTEIKNMVSNNFRASDAMHQKGLLYRDFKEENIIRARNGIVRLCPKINLSFDLQMKLIPYQNCGLKVKITVGCSTWVALA